MIYSTLYFISVLLSGSIESAIVPAPDMMTACAIVNRVESSGGSAKAYTLSAGGSYSSYLVMIDIDCSKIGDLKK